VQFRGLNSYFQEALSLEPGTTTLEILAWAKGMRLPLHEPRRNQYYVPGIPADPVFPDGLKYRRAT